MKEYIERTADNIEVFKTGIKDTHIAREIEQKLLTHFPDYCINFDLQDCDNVMRIEVSEGTVASDQVIQLVSGAGYSIEILP